MKNNSGAALIVKKLKAFFPKNKTSLIYRRPFELLVATILSAQSTDQTANRVSTKIFKKYKGIRDIAKANLREFQKDIYQSGFYRQKARNIIASAKLILKNFKGRVPRTMDELITLPGVGRKTANIILSSAFNVREGIAVDTHVKRISRRLGLSSNTDPVKIEQDLMRVLPRRYWLEFNYLLVNFGRAVCRAKRPLCVKCPVKSLCLEKNS
ncbi:MAG: endonuclease III [Candidatus Omnitrophica bacterium]|nr:endonuclease III [Candidatus Omnitrophota bacterium]